MAILMDKTLNGLYEALIRRDVDIMSCRIFEMPYSSLRKLIYPEPRYNTFIITKRDGSPRTIQEPRLAVKDLQNKLLNFLSERTGSPKPCVHGFTKGRSIVSNAGFHCNRQTHHLLSIDLEDFFHRLAFIVCAVYSKISRSTFRSKLQPF